MLTKHASKSKLEPEHADQHNDPEGSEQINYRGDFSDFILKYKRQRRLKIKQGHLMDPLYQFNMKQSQERDYNIYEEWKIIFNLQLKTILLNCAPAVFGENELIQLVLNYKKATIEEYLEFYGYKSQEEQQIIKCMLGRLFTATNNNIKKDFWELGFVIFHDHHPNGRSDLTYALMNSASQLQKNRSKLKKENKEKEKEEKEKEEEEEKSDNNHEFKYIWNVILPSQLEILQDKNIHSTINNILRIIYGEIITGGKGLSDEVIEKKFVLLDVPSTSPTFPSYFLEENSIWSSFRRRLFSLDLTSNNKNDAHPKLFHDFLELDSEQLIKTYQQVNNDFRQQNPWNFLTKRFQTSVKF